MAIYRLNITANSITAFSGYPQVAELRLSTVAGGPTVATNGTASADSENGPDAVARHAFDGNPATIWSGTANWPHWLQYDFGANDPTLVEFAITSSSDSSQVGQQTPPRDFTLLKSTDGGQTFTTLYTATGETFTTSQTKVYTLPVAVTPPPGAHRYWHFYITAAQDGVSYTAFSSAFMAATVGGPNLCTDPTKAIASSYDNRPRGDGLTFGPDQAIAATTSGIWNDDGNQSLPQSWGYDFGAGNKQSIAQFGLSSRHDNYAWGTPTALTLRYSDNGTDWTAVASVFPAWSATNQAQRFAVPVMTPTTEPRADWRFLITGSSGTLAGADTLAMFDVVGGSPINTDGTKASASSAYNSDYAAANGVPGQGYVADWASSASASDTAPQWWRYSFGAGDKRHIVAVSVTARSAFGINSPTDFIVQSSADDGANWNNEWAVSGSTGWANGETRNFLGPTPAPPPPDTVGPPCILFVNT